MSIGADPQMTLRDYFARYTGSRHALFVNMINDTIEFYVRPEGMEEKDGMHFTVRADGRIIEVGIWKEEDE